MASIEDIPFEIFSQIVSHFDSPETLCALSLVSKSVHASTESFLYHTYDDLASRPHGFYPFVRTIVQSPHLARHVKRLDIRAWKTESCGWRVTQPTLQDCASFNNAVRRLDIAHEVSWLHEWTSFLMGKACREPHTSCYMEDACTALLLSQLPNLQELQVEVTSRPAPKCTWRLFEEAGQNLELGVLNSLKRLSIYSEDVKYGHDMSPILSLYWLPSLETYNATYCQWGNTYLSDYAPAMPSMTSLDFDLCAFTAKAMELVLKHCKGLKIFRFSYYPLYMFDGQFTAADIVLLLRRYHLSTIERLRIDLDDGGSESESLKTIQLQEPLRLDQIMAGSLRDFSNLTFLSIGQQSLLGLLYLDERYRSDDEEQQWNTDVKLGDILPPSLKALIILYCDARIYRYLIEMASVRKERLPNLEWVGIGMAYSFCTEATFNLQGIMVIFSLHPPRD